MEEPKIGNTLWNNKKQKWDIAFSATEKVLLNDLDEQLEEFNHKIEIAPYKTIIELKASLEQLAKDLKNNEAYKKYSRRIENNIKNMMAGESMTASREGGYRLQIISGIAAATFVIISYYLTNSTSTVRSYLPAPFSSENSIKSLNQNATNALINQSYSQLIGNLSSLNDTLDIFGIPAKQIILQAFNDTINNALDQVKVSTTNSINSTRLGFEISVNVILLALVFIAFLSGIFFNSKIIRSLNKEKRQTQMFKEYIVVVLNKLKLVLTEILVKEELIKRISSFIGSKDFFLVREIEDVADIENVIDEGSAMISMPFEGSPRDFLIKYLDDDSLNINNYKIIGETLTEINNLSTPSLTKQIKKTVLLFLQIELNYELKYSNYNTKEIFDKKTLVSLLNFAKQLDSSGDKIKHVLKNFVELLKDRPRLIILNSIINMLSLVLVGETPDNKSLQDDIKLWQIEFQKEVLIATQIYVDEEYEELEKKKQLAGILKNLSNEEKANLRLDIIQKAEKFDLPDQEKGINKSDLKKLVKNMARKNLMIFNKLLFKLVESKENGTKKSLSKKSQNKTETFFSKITPRRNIEESSSKAENAILQKNIEENQLRNAAIASQRAITNINENKKSINCLVGNAEPDGNCGFTATALALKIAGHIEVAKNISRSNFIKLIHTLYDLPEYQSLIKVIFKADGAKDLQDWTEKFKSSGYWVEDSHFKLLSKYYNIVFKFYFNQHGEGSSENQEIVNNTDNDNKVKTIYLLQIKTNELSDNSVNAFNHFDAIIINPSEEQKRMIEENNSPKQLELNTDKKLSYNEEGKQPKK